VSEQFATVWSGAIVALVIRKIVPSPALGTISDCCLALPVRSPADGLWK